MVARAPCRTGAQAVSNRRVVGVDQLEVTVLLNLRVPLRIMRIHLKVSAVYSPPNRTNNIINTAAAMKCPVNTM